MRKFTFLASLSTVVVLLASSVLAQESISSDDQVTKGRITKETEREPNAKFGDVTGDLQVDIDDLLAVLAGWGTCSEMSAAPCTADLDGNGAIDVGDLLVVLKNWS